jgi:hypothetical protein
MTDSPLTFENSVEARRDARRRIPVVNLREEHTLNCRVLPDRQALLDKLPQNGIAAEVGVAFGDFTEQILSLNRPRLLHLIDAWDSERYRDGLGMIRQRFTSLLDAGGLKIHQGLSVPVLATFPEASFDWLYLDTDHSYETTLAELRVASAKVKPDGFIAGHDFCVGNIIRPWSYGVIEACNQFCVEARWQYRFLTLDLRGRHSFALSRL